MKMGSKNLRIFCLFIYSWYRALRARVKNSPKVTKFILIKGKQIRDYGVKGGYGGLKRKIWVLFSGNNDKKNGVTLR